MPNTNTRTKRLLGRCRDAALTVRALVAWSSTQRCDVGTTAGDGAPAPIDWGLERQRTQAYIADLDAAIQVATVREAREGVRFGTL